MKRRQQPTRPKRPRKRLCGSSSTLSCAHGGQAETLTATPHTRRETKDSCRYAIALTSLQLKDDQFPEEFSDLEDIATSVDLSFNLLADIPLPLLLLSNLQVCPLFLVCTVPAVT